MVLQDTAFLASDLGQIALDYNADIYELTVLRLCQTRRNSDRGLKSTTNAGWESELWHADNVEPGCFKIIIYLTDVSEDQAPFEYSIPAEFRPHDPNASWHDTRMPGSRRGRQVCGKAGTSIIFNPNIVHKGNYSRRGHRDAITLGLRMRPEKYHRKLKKRTIDQGFLNLVTGKTVSILGPSRSSQLNPPGLIDQYDLNVHLNHTWPVRPEFQSAMGSRCDILYSSCNKRIDVRDTILRVPELRNTRYFVCSPNVQYPAYADYAVRHGIPIRKMSLLDQQPVLDAIGVVPYRPLNIGFFAICDLLRYPIRALYVSGITFCCEDDYEHYGKIDTSTRRGREGPQTFHFADAQFEFFKQLLNVDPRISVDKVMADIIRLDKHRRVERFQSRYYAESGAISHER